MACIEVSRLWSTAFEITCMVERVMSEARAYLCRSSQSIGLTGVVVEYVTRGKQSAAV